MSGMSASLLKERRRFFIFAAFLAALVLLILGKLFTLMLLVPREEEQSTIRFPVVERGPILDRNGRILALSTRLHSITAWVPNIENPEQTAGLLAQALGLPDGEEILEKFRKTPGFLYIKRKITPTESERIKALLKEGRLKGISLNPEFGRSYPAQQLACHVLGYVGVDNVGLEGIEYAFNEVLSPSAIARDLKEVFGSQLFLTLDANIQFLLEESARKAMREHKADSVFIMAMEAHTGEILGYAAVPGYDPNEYGRFPLEQLQNFPLRKAYEPGSVFKIVSIASMLQLGALDADDEFTCNGFYELILPDGRKIRINDVGVHDRVNAKLILKYSCNAGAAYASERVEAEPFYRMLLDFGFGRPTGLPLVGETSGILPEPQKWSSRSKPTIAFGQEISVSALQVLQAATVFANDGLLIKPQIVRKIVSAQGEVIQEFTREPIREVLSPEVARQVLRMMESAAEEEGGTARRGRVAGLRIAAKTGTAQVPDPKSGGYSPIDYVASFLGLLPAEDPRLIIYVSIFNPRGRSYYGSQIAAPVFKEAAERLVPLLGIPRAGDTVVRHPGDLTLKLPPEITLEVGAPMPDLKGAPKRRLLPLLQYRQYVIRIQGDGYVVRQSPPPGAVLTEGMTIELELE